MNIPRLLRYDAEYIIPAEAVTDMQADKILPTSVTDVLRHPCGKSNIKARQELFADMQKGDLAERMTTLLSELKEYGRLLACYRKTNNRFDRIYLQIRILEEICHLYDLLSAFKDDGELFSVVAEFYPVRITTLKNDLSEIRARLKKTRKKRNRFSSRLRARCG